MRRDWRGFPPTLLTIVALLTIVSLFATTSSAAAHANLERSSPSSNTVVLEQPRQLQLWFSEEPEIRLTEIQLLDPTGRQIALLSPRPIPGDPLSVGAMFPDLPPGTYLVGWRTTSTTDGHTTRGAFPFTFGLGKIPVAVSTSGLSTTTFDAPSPLAILGRFLSFTGGLAMAGGLAFGPLVLLPAAAFLAGRQRRVGGGIDADILEDIADRVLTRTAMIAIPAMILGTIIMAVNQAATAANVSPLAAIGDPLVRAVVGTRSGYVFGARIGLALILAILMPFIVRRGDTVFVLAGLATIGGYLLTISLGSHAAAVPAFTAVVIGLDWIHLASAAIWIGGLAQLCFVVAAIGRRQSGPRIEQSKNDEDSHRVMLAALFSRFSKMSWFVLALIVTGTIQSLIHVGGFSALIETAYGQALMFKLAFVSLAGLVGLMHWRIVGPWLRQQPTQLSRWADGTARLADLLLGIRRRFGATLGLEVILGVAIILCTGFMTAQQPARDAAIALRSVRATAVAEDLSMALKVSPGEAGLNHLELAIGGPLTGLQKVVLRLSHFDMAMGEQEIEMTQVRDGVFAIDGGQFSMIGNWHVEPLVRRTNRDDARAIVTVPIGEPLTSLNADPPPPFELTPRMLLGIEAIIFGVIVLVGSRQLRGRGRHMSTIVALAGLFVIGTGGGMTVLGYLAETRSPLRLTNPVPLNAESLARGQLLYQQQCLSCHGLGGRGDGPVGRSLNPRPADLRTHVTQHTEGQIFYWITNGIPDTPMPAFKDQISVEDRWRITTFIKGFADDGPAPARTAVAELTRGRLTIPSTTQSAPVGPSEPNVTP